MGSRSSLATSTALVSSVDGAASSASVQALTVKCIVHLAHKAVFDSSTLLIRVCERGGELGCLSFVLHRGVFHSLVKFLHTSLEKTP